MRNKPFTPSQLQLWFYENYDLSAEREQQLIRCFSVTEKRRLENTKNPNKRQEFLQSRHLMRQALAHCFKTSTSDWDFIERGDLPPLVENLAATVSISLTHSKGFTCFAISDCPIGVDLEIHRERNFLDLAKEFMNPEEYKQFSTNKHDQASRFYQSWCAKEAYYKMLTLDEQSVTQLADLAVADLSTKNSKPFLFEQKISNYQLAVVSQRRPATIEHHYL